jgi:tetratricopeptide (TPR) repeat protein
MTKLPRVDISELPASRTANFTGAELASYLSTRRILIADTGAYSAQALQRILMQLVAVTNEILVYRSFASAAQGILARKPQILITDLHLDGELGLDLIALQEQQFHNRIDITSIVLVPDASAAKAGMIAEANVDAVMIKPLNLQSAKESLFQAFANKVKPSPYWSTLEKGKEHFNRTELEDAMRLFEEAKRFDPRPTLSYYYLGRIRQQQKRMEEALQSFQSGLALNPVDYRCLNATLELRMERSEHTEAYAIAQRLHEHYPINVRKLLDFVKLSISVGKFEDIPNYHRVFVNGETPDPKTARGIIAAMLVAGKSYAWREEREKAVDVLRSASKLALKQKILREESLRYWVETRLYNEAQDYFAELPASLKEDPTMQTLSLEAYHAMGDSNETIRHGTQLLKTGKAPARAYEIVIEHSRRLGRPVSVMNRIIAEAEENFPQINWRD